jgi:hypothetical protein
MPSLTVSPKLPRQARSNKAEWFQQAPCLCLVRTTASFAMCFLIRHYCPRSTVMCLGLLVDVVAAASSYRARSNITTMPDTASTFQRSTAAFGTGMWIGWIVVGSSCVMGCLTNSDKLLVAQNEHLQSMLSAVGTGPTRAGRSSSSSGNNSSSTIIIIVPFSAASGRSSRPTVVAKTVRCTDAEAVARQVAAMAARRALGFHLQECVMQSIQRIKPMFGRGNKHLGYQFNEEPGDPPHQICSQQQPPGPASTIDDFVQHVGGGGVSRLPGSEIGHAVEKQQSLDDDCWYW